MLKYYFISETYQPVLMLCICVVFMCKYLYRADICWLFLVNVCRISGSLPHPSPSWPVRLIVSVCQSSKGWSAETPCSVWSRSVETHCWTKSKLGEKRVTWHEQTRLLRHWTVHYSLLLTQHCVLSMKKTEEDIFLRVHWFEFVTVMWRLEYLPPVEFVLWVTEQKTYSSCRHFLVSVIILTSWRKFGGVTPLWYVEKQLNISWTKWTRV